MLVIQKLMNVRELQEIVTGSYLLSRSCANDKRAFDGTGLMVYERKKKG